MRLHIRIAYSNILLAKKNLKHRRYLICYPNIKSACDSLVYYENAVEQKDVTAVLLIRISITLNKKEFIHVSFFLGGLHVARRKLLHWMEGEEQEPRPKLYVPLHDAPDQEEGETTEYCDADKIEVRRLKVDDHFIQEWVEREPLLILEYKVDKSSLIRRTA